MKPGMCQAIPGLTNGPLQTTPGSPGCNDLAHSGALGLPTQQTFLHSFLGGPHRVRHDTCGRVAIRADLVDLVGLRWHVPGSIVDEAEVTALVKGTAQVGLPFGRVRLVHPLSVFSCLLGPGLGQEEKIGNHRESRPSAKPQTLLAHGSHC